MRIGYDIDNTTGDYENALRIFHAGRLGIPESEWTEKFPASLDYDMSKAGWLSMDTRDLFLNTHHDAVEEGMFGKMAMYPNAHDVMWRLHNAGHTSVIITARYLRKGSHHNINKTTSQWLDDNDVPVDELHITSDKVHVYADVYLDDSPHNIEVLRDAGRTVVIYDQPYNRHMDGLRAKDWNEFEQIINDMSRK